MPLAWSTSVRRPGSSVGYGTGNTAALSQDNTTFPSTSLDAKFQELSAVLATQQPEPSSSSGDKQGQPVDYDFQVLLAARRPEWFKLLQGVPAWSPAPSQHQQQHASTKYAWGLVHRMVPDGAEAEALVKQLEQLAAQASKEVPKSRTIKQRSQPAVQQRGANQQGVQQQQQRLLQQQQQKGPPPRSKAGSAPTTPEPCMSGPVCDNVDEGEESEEDDEGGVLEEGLAQAGEGLQALLAPADSLGGGDVRSRPESSMQPIQEGQEEEDSVAGSTQGNVSESQAEPGNPDATLPVDSNTSDATTDSRTGEVPLGVGTTHLLPHPPPLVEGSSRGSSSRGSSGRSSRASSSAVAGISSGSNTATSIVTAASITAAAGPSNSNPALPSRNITQGLLSLRARIEGPYYVSPVNSGANKQLQQQQQQRRGREAAGANRPPLMLTGLHDSGCEATHVPRALNMASMGRWWHLGGPHPSALQQQQQPPSPALLARSSLTSPLQPLSRAAGGSGTVYELQGTERGEGAATGVPFDRGSISSSTRGSSVSSTPVPPGVTKRRHSQPAGGEQDHPSFAATGFLEAPGVGAGGPGSAGSLRPTRSSAAAESHQLGYGSGASPLTLSHPGSPLCGQPGSSAAGSIMPTTLELQHSIPLPRPHTSAAVGGLLPPGGAGGFNRRRRGLPPGPLPPPGNLRVSQHQQIPVGTDGGEAAAIAHSQSDSHQHMIEHAHALLRALELDAQGCSPSASVGAAPGGSTGKQQQVVNGCDYMLSPGRHKSPRLLLPPAGVGSLPSDGLHNTHPGQHLIRTPSNDALHLAAAEYPFEGGHLIAEEGDNPDGHHHQQQGLSASPVPCPRQPSIYGSVSAPLPGDAVQLHSSGPATPFSSTGLLPAPLPRNSLSGGSLVKLVDQAGDDVGMLPGTVFQHHQHHHLQQNLSLLHTSPASLTPPLSPGMQAQSRAAAAAAMAAAAAAAAATAAEVLKRTSTAAAERAAAVSVRASTPPLSHFFGSQSPGGVGIRAITPGGQIKSHLPGPLLHANLKRPAGASAPSSSPSMSPGGGHMSHLSHLHHVSHSHGPGLPLSGSNSPGGVIPPVIGGHTAAAWRAPSPGAGGAVQSMQAIQALQAIQAASTGSGGLSTMQSRSIQRPQLPTAPPRHLRLSAATAPGASVYDLATAVAAAADAYVNGATSSSSPSGKGLLRHSSVNLSPAGAARVLLRHASLGAPGAGGKNGGGLGGADDEPDMAAPIRYM